MNIGHDHSFGELGWLFNGLCPDGPDLRIIIYDCEEINGSHIAPNYK